MTPIATTLLALSMSADAFAVAAGKGATLRHAKTFDAMKMGAVFGGTEATVAVIGWSLGFVASTFITAIDHWIAFAILITLGLKMIAEAFAHESEKKEKPKKQKIKDLIITAIGTSIDSLGIGVTLAFMDANIWITALAIGTATFSMSTFGIKIGHAIGQKVGKIAEALGGTVLIVIGTRILLEHTGII